MAGEIVPGRRTYIKRPGRDEFELPDQHTAEIIDLGSLGEHLQLATPQMGGMYRIVRRSEDDERVILEVGEAAAESGLPSFGHSVSEVTGYPFPD